MTFRIPRRLAHYIVEPSESGSSGATSLMVFLRRLPGGPTLVLVETAALIWVLALETRDVPNAVAEAVREPVDNIRIDVEAYLDSLVAQGLLEAAASRPIAQGRPL